jgi:hypothetical protein
MSDILLSSAEKLEKDPWQLTGVVSYGMLDNQKYQSKFAFMPDDPCSKEALILDDWVIIAKKHFDNTNYIKDTLNQFFSYQEESKNQPASP